MVIVPNNFGLNSTVAYRLALTKNVLYVIYFVSDKVRKRSKEASYKEAS